MLTAGSFSLGAAFCSTSRGGIQIPCRSHLGTVFQHLLFTQRTRQLQRQFLLPGEQGPALLLRLFTVAFRLPKSPLAIFVYALRLAYLLRPPTRQNRGILPVLSQECVRGLLSSHEALEHQAVFLEPAHGL